MKKIQRNSCVVRANVEENSVSLPEFETDDEAHEFYNMYVGKVGFTVKRANITIGLDNIITKMMFICSTGPVLKNLIPRTIF